MGALAAAHNRNAIGEVTCRKNGKLGALLYKVAYRGFHCPRSTAGNEQHFCVSRAHHFAQTGLDFGHHGEEVGVANASERLAHGLVGARIDHRGSGPENEPLGRRDSFHSGRRH